MEIHKNILPGMLVFRWLSAKHALQNGKTPWHQILLQIRATPAGKCPDVQSLRSTPSFRLKLNQLMGT